MQPKYTATVERSRNGEFFWRLSHRNGRQIARSSETYKRRATCKRGLLRLIASLGIRDYALKD